MEKAEVDMIVILNFLAFGRAVVCEEDEVDQSTRGLGACLSCVDHETAAQYHFYID
jgi:hypothetical protein